MFADVRGRRRKEQISLRVNEELNRLSKALATARRQGRVVDMHALQIHSSGSGGDQIVVLTDLGNSLRLYLPTLADAPGVVDIARSWIAARSEGRAYRQHFPQAEILLSNLLERR